MTIAQVSAFSPIKNINLVNEISKRRQIKMMILVGQLKCAENAPAEQTPD
jgi:hypothetical protein